jgi:low affinity Fe/Cu permease
MPQQRPSPEPLGRPSRSATPIIRPRTDAPVRETDTLRGRLYVLFGEFSNRTAIIIGSPWAFIVAVVSIVVWAVSGPLFGFSDTWQLIVNTATTVVTFLIVFLIQHTQNKDARAIQLKLNEILAALEGASNRLINIEKLSDAELDHLQQQFEHLASRLRASGEASHAHSVEEEEPAEVKRP